LGQEIERKFLVDPDGAWRQGQATRLRQGYLSTVPERTVRVRTIDDQGYLTLKGKTVGATRREFEYEIPGDEATQILDALCQPPLIEKTRYVLDYGGLTWEVDEFYGENEGLILAEVELEREDQPFERPPWLGQEVTEDQRYYNANLVEKPYTRWTSYD
jgi:CYTH domain-containing protein